MVLPVVEHNFIADFLRQKSIECKRKIRSIFLPPFPRQFIRFTSIFLRCRALSTPSTFTNLIYFRNAFKFRWPFFSYIVVRTDTMLKFSIAKHNKYRKRWNVLAFVGFWEYWECQLLFSRERVLCLSTCVWWTIGSWFRRVLQRKLNFEITRKFELSIIVIA